MKIGIKLAGKMNLLLASVLVLLGCLLSGVEPKSYKATTNRGSGISIGGSSNSNSNNNDSSRGSSGASSSGSSSRSQPAVRNQLNVGLLVPHTNFGRRDYLRSINTAVMGLQKGRGPKLTFLKDHEFQTSNIHFDMMSLTPSPTGYLTSIIDKVN